MTNKTKAQLEADVATLAARVAELEKAAKGPELLKREPHTPLDLTANASMPPSAFRDLVAAVPDSLVDDLRADAAKGNPVTQSTSLMPASSGQAQVQRGSGWSEPRPLSPPPGVPIMDRLMDMQDKIDKADLQRRLGATAKDKER